ncbi:hypothetical protein OROGR_014413 [Orobanche gracilis]
MAAANREREWTGESQSLLHSHEDGLSEKSETPRKKEVQWLDENGEELAKILEFQPSDLSDSVSDGEDSDSCICRIM